MGQHQVSKGKPLNSKKLPLKKLNDQVIVLTGATSGIGLATARMAAEKGAKLVLAARNEDDLKQLTEELTSKGHQAIYVPTDVAKQEEVDYLAETAIATYGGFDTWVNDAAVFIFGHAYEVPIEDYRHMFDVNFWGQVYGTRAAIRHYKKKGIPGAIINLGSMVGKRGMPVQSTYSSTKFAINGFTQNVRMELEKEGAPVSVTQILPGRIDTPVGEHATSYIDKQPVNQGMLYPPEAVAEAILSAAEKPVRHIYVGSQAKFMALVGQLFPRFTDRLMEKSMYSTNFDSNRQAEPPEKSTLYHPESGLDENSDSNIGMRRKRSYMVKAKKHSGLTAAAVAAGTGLVFLAVKMKK